MIVIYHNQKQATLVHDLRHKTDLFFKPQKLSSLLYDVAAANNDRLIIWCDHQLKDNVNFDYIASLQTTENTMISFCGSDAIPDAVSYVEQSGFIKVSKNVRFATWRMSSAIGAVHAKAILALKDIPKDGDFGYYLNSVAKLAMPYGLFCYSDPKLVIDSSKIRSVARNDDRKLFRFVRQHFKLQWNFLLVLNLVVYEKRFPFVAFIACFFYRRRTFTGDFNLPKALNPQPIPHSLDVIIPTIGRKQYLLDVLRDLAAQTVLPAKIIIVEQNPLPESTTELDYLTDKWPFAICHKFTNQPGACNARNLALAEIQSDWVFFADDDIRIGPDFVQQAFSQIEANRNSVFNFCCLQKGQTREFSHIHQTTLFATGCSFANSQALRGLKFDMGYEFGFGEDSDFGMQLRNKGYDIVYLPEPMLLHLKAPVGGFRTKPELAWHRDKIQPKPSPTVMLFNKRYLSPEQLRGYKLILFFKYYLRQPIRNPQRYFAYFRTAWQRSVFWAQQIERN